MRICSYPYVSFRIVLVFLLVFVKAVVRHKAAIEKACSRENDRRDLHPVYSWRGFIHWLSIFRLP